MGKQNNWTHVGDLIATRLSAIDEVNIAQFLNIGTMRVERTHEAIIAAKPTQ